MSILRFFVAAVLLQTVLGAHLRSMDVLNEPNNKKNKNKAGKQQRRATSSNHPGDDDGEYDGCFCGCNLWYDNEEGQGVIMYATDAALQIENGGNYMCVTDEESIAYSNQKKALCDDECFFEGTDDATHEHADGDDHWDDDDHYDDDHQHDDDHWSDDDKHHDDDGHHDDATHPPTVAPTVAPPGDDEVYAGDDDMSNPHASASNSTGTDHHGDDGEGHDDESDGNDGGDDDLHDEDGNDDGDHHAGDDDDHAGDDDDHAFDTSAPVAEEEDEAEDEDEGRRKD